MAKHLELGYIIIPLPCLFTGGNDNLPGHRGDHHRWYPRIGVRKSSEWWLSEADDFEKLVGVIK